LLLVIGILTLYSEGYGRPGGGVFRQHLLRVAVGIVPFVLFYVIKPSFWRKIATPLYLANLLLLLLVLVSGSTGGGAQRWLELGPLEFQPSEMSKLLVVMAVSTFFASRWEDHQRLSTFLLSFLLVVPTLVLVFLQPHLGATLVILVAWLSVAIFAYVPWKFIILMVLVAATLLVAAVKIPGLLRPYQIDRVMGLFSNNEQSTGYQQSRAAIAFGVGGLGGVGFLKGEQKSGRFIPEQHTDFVFTVIGEEGGLVGSTLVLIAFAAFFYRGWLVVYRADQPFHRMLAAGVLSLLAFHVVVNLAMNLQVGPVVGLWLPFLSYGGTALWLCLACSGLLLNLSRTPRSLMFSQGELR